MKAYNLIYENSVVGYRIDTNTGLGVVDIDLETANKYGINPEIVSSLQLYNSHGKFVTMEEHGRSKVKDISDDTWICSSLSILMNEDANTEDFINVYTGDSLENLLNSYSSFNDSDSAYVSEVIGYFHCRNKLTLLCGGDEDSKTNVMLQAVNCILKDGIDSNKIVFCSVKDGARMPFLNGLLECLYRNFKMKYIFVDDFTIAKGDLVMNLGLDMELSYCSNIPSCSLKYVFSSAITHPFTDYFTKCVGAFNTINLVDMR